MEGIFKTDAILKSPLSGQAPKDQGEELRNLHYKCLNGQARRAIIGKNQFLKYN